MGRKFCCYFQEWQATLDIEINQFVDVDEVKRDVQDKISLWSDIKDWKLKINDWISAPFENIYTETITLEAEKYTKIVIRCEKDFLIIQLQLKS